MIEQFYLPRDETLTGTITPRQSGLECNGNERALKISQISKS